MGQEAAPAAVAARHPTAVAAHHPAAVAARHPAAVAARHPLAVGARHRAGLEEGAAAEAASCTQATLLLISMPAWGRLRTSSLQMTAVPTAPNMPPLTSSSGALQPPALATSSTQTHTARRRQSISTASSTLETAVVKMWTQILRWWSRLPNGPAESSVVPDPGP